MHPLAILLADFMVIKDTRVSIPLIYITWWIMTMSFSVVMWSRLHLIMRNSKYLRWVLYMIICTTLFISIPSMVIGPMSVRLNPFQFTETICNRPTATTHTIRKTTCTLLQHLGKNRERNLADSRIHYIHFVHMVHAQAFAHHGSVRRYPKPRIKAVIHLLCRRLCAKLHQTLAPSHCYKHTYHRARHCSSRYCLCRDVVSSR